MGLSENFVKKLKKKYSTQRNSALHSCAIGPNLHSQCTAESSVWNDLISDHHDLSFACSNPVPFGMPSIIAKEVVNGVDPALKLVSEKRKYISSYKKMLRSCTVKDEQLSDLTSQVESGVDSIKMHPNIASLAQMASLDPDPYFDNNYNCYYSGTLAVANLQNKTYLIHPQHEINNSGFKNLTITEPKYTKKLLDYSSSIYHVAHDLDPSSPIYQIDTLSDLLILRQRSQLTLFKVHCDETQLSINKVLTIPTYKSFISSRLNQYNLGEFAVLRSNFKIDTYTVDNNLVTKRSIKMDFLDHHDFWGTIDYHDENVITVCNRSTMTLVDLRGPVSEANVMQWDVGPLTEHCEEIYSSIKGASLHYVCTNHSLLSLDIRKGWFQRWTHSIPQSPYLLSLLPCSTTEESLVIGGQNNSYTTYIHNSGCEEFNSSTIQILPYRLPSLKETLHKARLSQVCLSPLVASRFSMSLTGLASVGDSSNFNLFSCTSIGDMFSQKIILQHDLSSSTSQVLTPLELDRLKLWESEVLKQTIISDHKVKATSLKSFQHLQNIFDTETSLKMTDSEDFPCAMGSQSSVVQPWCKSKASFLTYSSKLDTDLLACWKLEEEKEWGDPSDVESTHKRARESDGDSDDDPLDKVQNWLTGFINELQVSGSGDDDMEQDS